MLSKFKSKPSSVSIFWPLVAFALLLAFNWFFTPGFFHMEMRDGHLFGIPLDILNRGAPIILLSIGMTLVYATGGIDLSVGAVMAISGALAAYIIRPQYSSGVLEYQQDVSMFLVLAIPMIASLLCGLWNGILVAKVGVQPIIATLILMVTGRGIAQLITKGNIIVFEHESFNYLGSGFLLGLPVPIVIGIFLLVITYLLTRKTALGLFIEAVGANPIASRFMGLKSSLIVTLVYVFSGFCAGLAGLVVCSDIKAADANNAGLFFELDAIAAVIIGGTLWGGRFTLAGSVLGALIIQTLTTTILAQGVAPEVTLVFKAAVILSVALIQSPNIRQAITSKISRPKTGLQLP